MANVLIVDDDPVSCRALARLLEMAGHAAFTVHDGRAALALLDRVRPDMIVLDVMMPELSGIDVLARLREHPVHRDVPVVVYSARADQPTIDQALAGGARDYLVKSRVDFRALTGCVDRHLAPAHG